MKLGLIGDGIALSRAPRFHELASSRKGLDVSYTLHDLSGPSAPDLDTQFDRCVADGYAGFNVTHPYKERVIDRVRIGDPMVKAMGAVNTVIVSRDGEPYGHNTDSSGFVFGWRRYAAALSPGAVLVLGAGGAGRAIAFALVRLNASALRIFDVDASRAESLVRDLCTVVPRDVVLDVVIDPVDAVNDVDGVVNATPVGMAKLPGMPIAVELIPGRRWVFDAVYTPEQTAFIRAAHRAGVHCLTGFGLFLGQGVDAFRHFSGKSLSDEDIGYIEATIRDDIARTET